MKVIVPLAITLSLQSFDAGAISRYNSQRMTCERVQAVLRAEGAAILSYRSPADIPLYDRYVQHAGYCETGKYSRLASVPTRDTRSCPVLKCAQRSYAGGR